MAAFLCLGPACSLLIDPDDFQLLDADAGDLPDSGEPSDAGFADSAETPPDAAGLDAAQLPPDASAALDAGRDAGPDAGRDAGLPDASAGADAGAPDAQIITETCVGGWCRVKPEVFGQYGSKISIGSLHAVTGTPDGTVWVAGQNSLVLRWDGARWQVDNQGVGYIYGLWIDPSGHGVAVGYDGAGKPSLARRSPAGTWTKDAPPSLISARELQSVWGEVVSGQVRAWAVGGTDELWRLEAGSWSVETLPGVRTANAVWGLREGNSTRLVFASDDGVFSIPSGGSAVDESKDFGAFNLFGPGDGTLWAGGYDVLRHRVLPGPAWTEVPTPSGKQTAVYATCGRGGRDLLVAAQQRPAGEPSSTGAILELSPTADVLVDQSIPASEVLEDCWVAPSGEAWAVGWEGFQPPTGIILRKRAP